MPNVVTYMFKVCDNDVYALLDLGATFSFITPLIASRFAICLKIFCEPFFGVYPH